MSQIWNNILDVFESALSGLHDIFVPLAGVHSWGFAVIALTLIIRVLLLPLAVKQIRSMRAMQAIQPQMKAIQKKYKVDRDLMKKDPDQYRAKKAKMNEEMMALYQAEGVNPAASCLPLLAQAPVFFALFSILRGDRAADLANEPFYFLTSFIREDSEFSGLGALVSQASWPGWLLIVLMGATMFISQKQVMARQSATGGENPMAQQQKVLLYVMPVFLAVISFNLPLGVLLYWVTTNAWQAGQQWFMLREVEHEVEEGTLAEHRGGEAARGGRAAGWLRRRFGRGGPTPAATEGDVSPRRSPGATSGAAEPKGSKPADDLAGPADRGTDRAKKPGGAGGAKAQGKGGTTPKGGSPNGAAGGARPSAGGKKNRDHLPRRGQQS